MNGSYYLGVVEAGQVDTIIRTATKSDIVQSRIAANKIELIRETPMTFEYILLVKKKGAWKMDLNKSSQITSNKKLLSACPPNYLQTQPNSETFRFASKNEIQYKMKDGSLHSALINMLQQGKQAYLNHVRTVSESDKKWWQKTQKRRI